MVVRADALRNRERVLDAAAEVFAASGPDASVDDVAHRAGVGHGTVLRHFRTKDDLVYAVVERHVERMCQLAEEAIAAPDPGEAFFRFARSVAELSMTTPGLHRCVAHCGGKPGAAQLQQLGTKLVARAQRAGALRKDVQAADVGPLIRAALLAAPEGQWRRYLDVVLDGLRPAASR